MSADQLDINTGPGCEACGWNTNREHHMVPVYDPATAGGAFAYVDPCIRELVRGLNQVGIETVASCCGHGSNVPPSVILADDRVIVVFDWDQAARLGVVAPREEDPINDPRNWTPEMLGDAGIDHGAF